MSTTTEDKVTVTENKVAEDVKMDGTQTQTQTQTQTAAGDEDEEAQKTRAVRQGMHHGIHTMTRSVGV